MSNREKFRVGQKVWFIDHIKREIIQGECEGCAKDYYLRKHNFADYMSVVFNDGPIIKHEYVSESWAFDNKHDALLHIQKMLANKLASIEADRKVILDKLNDVNNQIFFTD